MFKEAYILTTGEMLFSYDKKSYYLQGTDDSTKKVKEKDLNTLREMIAYKV